MECAGAESKNPLPAHAGRGLIDCSQNPLRRAVYDYRNYYDEDGEVEHGQKLRIEIATSDYNGAKLPLASEATRRRNNCSGDLESTYMTAPLMLDGKALAKQIESELAARVEVLKSNHGYTPVLAVILVGADPSSIAYVKMKANACRRAGIEAINIELAVQTTTEALLDRISELNRNPEVHGILLQHPVPPARTRSV